MELSLRDIKRRARELIKKPGKPRPLAVALVFTLITVAASFFLNKIDGATAVINTERMEELTAMAEAGQFPGFEEFASAVEIHQPKPDLLSGVLTLALQFIGILVTGGFCLYALRHVRDEGGEMGNLLDGFGQFYRVCMVSLLRSILTALGFCCFIIPGVRLLYGYRMANYLLWDHPDWTPLQCLHNSRVMMNGRKRKVFLIDLSFLCWLILGGLPFSLAGYFWQQRLYGFVFSAVMGGCVISAYVALYRELTLSLWYNMALCPPQEENSEKPPWEY